MNQNGQIILVILLVMAVGLTIGLSVTSRSLTDVRFSTQLEESNRAFSAAEAGIEEVLKQGIYSAPSNINGTIGTGGTGVKYNVDLSPLQANTNHYYIFDREITDGDSETVWLVPHTNTGSPDLSRRYYWANRDISVCWKDLVSGTKSAIEISVFYTDSTATNFYVARLAFDPDDIRNNTNKSNFTTTGINPSTCVDPSDQSAFNYQVQWRLDDNTVYNPAPSNSRQDILVALRIRPIYAAAKIGVIEDDVGNGQLPEQGKNITSTGLTNTGASRKWTVEQTYSSSPDIFDYSVWSGTTLEKF